MKVLRFRYATSVVPIGAMFAMTLWLGNTAYLYISVAFAQMLKAISKSHYSYIMVPLWLNILILQKSSHLNRLKLFNSKF